jgi:aminoglycoside phosphotransferase family enzyme/predicted kinase
VRSLLTESRWPSGGGDRQRVDTHISSVVLAGEHAYKVKKPVDLGFLNFSTLDDRRCACEEELRLNRRLAPDLYQAVCAVTGSIDSPSFDGPGEAIDWAVRMRRFDPEAVLSNPRIPITPSLVDRLASRVGAFHLAADRAADDSEFGTPPLVADPMWRNFTHIRAQLPACDGRLDKLEGWIGQALAVLEDTLAQRRADGHVRECHGDLHLGNIALIDGEPVVFDAIEFNPAFRWIDTVNDLAFLTMDLHHRRLSGLAYRFLDRYLARTGDYAGLAVLQLYEVYRAMVRAKIAAIRRGQLPAGEGGTAIDAEFDAYLALAERLSGPRRGALVITHGLSGSGKSHQTAALSDVLPAVRLRSDVERKRMLGIDAHADATAQGGYSAELTKRTYSRLAELARDVIDAGYVAIVDATFLKRIHRRRFRDLAEASQVPFIILDFEAPADVLRARIRARVDEPDNVSDAGLEVLEMQLRGREPLDPGELAGSIRVTPDASLSIDRLRERIVY